jgi:hypothetical protein
MELHLRIEPLYEFDRHLGFYCPISAIGFDHSLSAELFKPPCEIPRINCFETIAVVTPPSLASSRLFRTKIVYEPDERRPPPSVAPEAFALGARRCFAVNVESHG